jgi:hypothetical protein
LIVRPGSLVDWFAKGKKKLNNFGSNIKGSYLCTPIEKMGGKKGQKIFESLEATARYFDLFR